MMPTNLPADSYQAGGAFAAKVDKDLIAQLESARVWGSGAFDCQIVSREHVLTDRDIIELRT